MAALARARHQLRRSAEGLTLAQATRRTTVSELTLAGLLKHLADAEESWMHFAVHGAMGMNYTQAYFDQTFTPAETDTLESLLARYAAVARHTDEIITTADTLDTSHQLPEAPWFYPDQSWSMRRVVAMLIAETAQHAGHASLIRESLDGKRPADDLPRAAT
ncbi:putative damage-inducible protein DinB [Crossiella equi]|uniref:Damage-inducible protein DinB n=1 Tax=Crossiella equi TaxID=130796 RepID=A0ABS5AG38_9PSEU|nr:DinB family protein [Crossiella equi]MBP2475232.1 putative damage-inducible protein DinB [Crossiella equi]